MRTIIAEKPSVAKDIAAYLGCRESKDGYLQNNEYFVTWAYGHLFEIKSFEELGYQGNWNIDSVPYIPDNYDIKLKDDSGVKKQYKIIKELLSKSYEVICATDAGREGELIFRYIYNHSKTSIPIKRLWLKALTNEAIARAFKDLRPGIEYDNLFNSAVSRNQADYLVGLNATIALTSKNQIGLLSLGRVQTPTLALICERYIQYHNFQPEAYYTITSKLFKNFSFKASAVDKWKNKSDAEKVYSTIKEESKALIKNIESKEVKETPPLLYDLAGLQKDANKYFSFSANETLEIAQALYEKKVLTYPRTGSCYISEDIYKEVPELLNKIFSQNNYAIFKNDFPKNINKKSVNDNKVTDHHAILLTGNFNVNLTSKEENVLNIVAIRMLQAFHDNCLKKTTSIDLNIKDVPFKASGTIITYKGWRNISFKEDNNSDGNLLPELSVEESVEIQELKLNELFTTPKPIHTEASLIEAMETCGKDVEEEDLKEAMKENGIGTPATRASIIETLIKRNYMVREKKQLLPSKLGLQIYYAIKNELIAQPILTGEWENKLLKMESGNYSKGTFDNEIENYTKELVQSIINSSSTIKKDVFDKCPKCNGNLYESSRVIYCENSKDNDCKFPSIFKNIASKNLDYKTIKQLIEKGETDIVKGFKSKDGNSFDASLKINADNKIVFSFEKADLGTCPKCQKKKINEYSKAFSCDGFKDKSCDFSIWKEMAGKKISTNLAQKLIEKGETNIIKGFTGKNGKFDCKLVINEDFKVIFKF